MKKRTANRCSLPGGGGGEEEKQRMAERGGENLGSLEMGEGTRRGFWERGGVYIAEMEMVMVDGLGESYTYVCVNLWLPRDTWRPIVQFSIAHGAFEACLWFQVLLSLYSDLFYLCYFIFLIPKKKKTKNLEVGWRRVVVFGPDRVIEHGERDRDRSMPYFNTWQFSIYKIIGLLWCIGFCLHLLGSCSFGSCSFCVHAWRS